MRPKVLLVNGSPHRRGNTFTALSEVAKTLDAEGVDIEIVHIGNRPVQGCIGCYRCKEKGICVFQDETYLTLRNGLAEADGIVIGSPVYFGGPSGKPLRPARPPVLFQRKSGAIQAGGLRGGMPSRRSHRRLRPAEQVLHHPQHACCAVTILEQRTRTQSGRGPAGCGRPANHAHVGSQHGVDAVQLAGRHHPFRDRRQDTYKLYPMNCT